MQCGLLGRRLSHSYSPQIHSHLGNYTYSLFEKEPDELEIFFRDNKFNGINVTIPYKKDVIRFCDVLSESAKKLGAVNTIVRDTTGRLIGHNTDYYGFASTVNKTKLSVSDKKVLVLGSGGASVTACAVLRELGAKVIVISRSGENNYSNLNKHCDAAVIVNTTPVGMYPNTDGCPIDLSVFPNLEGVLDMIYNPARTKLLQQAEKRNIIAENGLWMLVAQAKKSAELFQNTHLNDNVIGIIHSKLKYDMENLILIGMPGCGKSTIGALLANQTGRKFIDSDSEIVKKAKMSIPEIFENYGEIGFRRLESDVLKELGKESGLVIATGGGCVTQPENYGHLHQNGRIIWIQRELHALATDGRPLSKTDKLEMMLKTRTPLYNAFADVIIDNARTPSDAVLAILNSITLED